MFRVSLAQSPADLAGPSDRLDWLRAALPEVVAAGSDLVVLPELFACGYNIGDAIPDRAEPADGPTFGAIAAMARAFGVAIHYGFAERAGEDLFNAVLCVSPGGDVLSHQRKLAIPPGFERAHFTPGQGVQIFDCLDLKIATLICYDAEFPETVRHAASLGADLVLVPTALGAEWGWVAGTMIPTRAYENGVYLAYVNSAGVENGMAYLGASVLAAPDGVEVLRAGPGPEILHAEIDTTRIRAAQARLPYLKDRGGIRLT